MMLLLLIVILIPSINSLQYDVKSVVDRLNFYRQIHQAAPLIWSSKINNVAQNWADNLANLNKFYHSDNDYGENIGKWWCKSNDYAPDYTIAINQMNDVCYVEGNNYNYTNTEFIAGHFTQLIWKSSKYVGIGVACGGNNLYIVVNFDPPGNYVGYQYLNNVLPPLQKYYPSPRVLRPSPHPSPKPTSQLSCTDKYLKCSSWANNGFCSTIKSLNQLCSVSCKNINCK